MVLKFSSTRQNREFSRKPFHNFLKITTTKLIKGERDFDWRSDLRDILFAVFGDNPLGSRSATRQHGSCVVKHTANRVPCLRNSRLAVHKCHSKRRLLGVHSLANIQPRKISYGQTGKESKGPDYNTAHTRKSIVTLKSTQPPPPKNSQGKEKRQTPTKKCQRFSRRRFKRFSM